ncbi:prepilin-type N-terminal cleavage/methylation domain-containing protein [Microbacterium alcoholitolerans]|uniref:prepilin-type N-terminal cleavage/methylation domain-containing protein n=1 Tax=unclassified Microbacterium TaxID=2609290 RepID=UPI003D164A41
MARKASRTSFDFVEHSIRVRGLRATKGFTIVELLIVVVVIAILAAITIVAYNGISNTANDSAVQADLSNLARKVQLVHARTGSYPAGGRVTTDGSTWTGASTNFPEVQIKLAHRAYDDSPNTLAYCSGPDNVTGSSEFRILAHSRSGRYYEYSSMDGLTDRGTAYLPIYEHLSTCDGFGLPRSFSSAYNSNTNVWSDWAQ